MPLALGAIPLGITITVEDRDKNSGSTTVYVPVTGTTTVADMVADAAAAEAAINVLTNGTIVGGSISIPLIQTTAFVEPPAESDVERKGVINFSTSNAASASKMEIPSLDNTTVVDGTDIISSAVSAALLASLTGLSATNGVGFAVEAVRSAYKAHRRSKRG